MQEGQLCLTNDALLIQGFVGVEIVVEFFGELGGLRKAYPI